MIIQDHIVDIIPIVVDCDRPVDHPVLIDHSTVFCEPWFYVFFYFLPGGSSADLFLGILIRKDRCIIHRDSDVLFFLRPVLHRTKYIYDRFIGKLKCCTRSFIVNFKFQFFIRIRRSHSPRTRSITRRHDALDGTIDIFMIVVNVVSQ